MDDLVKTIKLEPCDGVALNVVALGERPEQRAAEIGAWLADSMGVTPARHGALLIEAVLLTLGSAANVRSMHEFVAKNESGLEKLLRLQEAGDRAMEIADELVALPVAVLESLVRDVERAIKELLPQC
jgi:hypothetical protein